MSKATITIDYYEAFGLTKSPLFGAACIDQASSYLEGAEQAPLRAFTKQWSPAMGNIIDPKETGRSAPHNPELIRPTSESFRPALI